MQAKLIILCLVPTILLAQEAAPEPKPAPDPTAHALAASHALIRLPSADRIDALGKDLLPMIKGFLPAEIAGVVEKGSASSLLIAVLGLGGKEIARDKPIYVSPLPHGVYTIASGKEGLVMSGPPGTTDAAKRGKPTAMLDGDIAVHVYADELIAELKPRIESVLNMASGMAAMLPIVPGPVKKLVPAVMDIGRDAIYGIESYDYALTLKGSILLSEGRITTKPGSNLRAVLAKAGPPEDNVLAGYLPRGALLYRDGAGADWMSGMVAGVFEKKLGEGASLAFGHMMGPDVATWGVTTGRSASSVQMQGMMSGTILSIHELKEGVDPKTVIDKFDAEKVNAALKQHGIGLSYSVKKNVAAHGETKMHQIVIDATDPTLGMMTMVEIYVAAEGQHMLVVKSMSAADDMKALIDRVRGEPDMNHPHIKAMSRLGRKRHTGMTMNISGIKPLGMLFNFFAPQLAQVINNLPDNLTMSTAITVADGNIHWRGDWPVKEMSAFATAMKGLHEGPKKKPLEDEDFD